jgi:ergothioneine biosynthesis protein EgtB
MAVVATEAGKLVDGSLRTRYQEVRGFSDLLCETLSPDDCTVQSMPDVSPTRWHLAHTTWFFEEFVLASRPDYRPYNEAFGYLFNSYYNTLGKQYPRTRRGMLSRPSLGEIFAYRQYVDEHLVRVLESGAVEEDGRLTSVLQTGLHHEQQHQELILTDIKHVFAQNPLWSVFRDGTFAVSPAPRAQRWSSFNEGLQWVGHDGDGFSYDNEGRRHRVFLQPFELSGNLVTCGEYLEFMADGGYQRPELWLSDGWRAVQERRWRAPLYWTERDGTWTEFTLAGLREVDSDCPVCHVSYFEADAFARWAGARLPTEFEWEIAAGEAPIEGNFADSLIAKGRAIHPSRLCAGGVASEPAQLFGDVWEWTASQYTAFPGYKPPEGAIGEYNGKFMCNQFVLRGGSCATSRSHIRRTYRNFFPPDARWQFSGIRLAR